MEIFFEPDLPNRPGFVFNRCRECDSAHALSFTSVAVNDRLRAKGFKIVNPIRYYQHPPLRHR
jgi:hypothetical protein